MVNPDDIPELKIWERDLPGTRIRVIEFVIIFCLGVIVGIILTIFNGV